MGSIDTLIPTETEIVARAEAMIPWLRERADACEKARMVSPETIRKFKDAGFFRILQPRRWGGYEMHPNVLNRVLMELARGCPSSAWNVMVLGVHPFEVGLLPERCGDELWSEDNTRLVSSSYAPFGTVTKVEGGYVLNGEWLTSSGCDHADGGAFLGGRVAENGEQVFRSFWVQRADFDIIDDWNVVGLAGTGSKKLSVKEVFVPDYRSHVIAAYDE
ncbi:MAG: acyl-CoA dehydrogenase family protein, partial [Proteobacteria bacterium]|nr:acyl-CoA dehydrogenase family protein [Pseudomonadota bacterium]